MTAPRARTPTAYYGAAAEAFAARYDAARFDDVHRALLAFLPALGSAILDVGSGSGRDALALSQLGYRVVAAEPTAALRRHAERADIDHQVEWIDDRLPRLGRLAAAPARFAFILCSAVLMHVEPSDLPGSFSTMGSLLLPDGILAVSVRPPLPDEPEDVFHNHSPDALRCAAQGAGLSPSFEAELTDSLGRADIRWRTLVFRRGSDAAA